MKKKLILCLAAMTMAIACQAMNAKQFIDKYSNDDEASVVNVGGFGMMLARMMGVPTMGVKCVKVVEFEKCNSSRRDQIIEDMKKLDQDGYDIVVKDKSGKNEASYVLLKGDEESVKSLFVVDVDNNDCSIVYVSGNIKMSDIEDIEKKYDKDNEE